MSIGVSSVPSPFDPREFLHLAQRLVVTSSAEAELRTAIGRAYYTAFLLFRGRFFGPNPPRTVRRQSVRGGQETIGIHKAVIEKVSQRDSALGGQLDKLHGLRKEADYQLVPSDPGYANWDTNWQKAESLAQHLLNNIRKI